MIKKTVSNFIQTFTTLAPVAVYSLFLGALSATFTGLFFELDYFPASLFYVISSVFYFTVYFLLQCQHVIKSFTESVFHFGLSGLFLGFFSYQVFGQMDWFTALVTIWEYKLIFYLVASAVQATVLIVAKDWLAKQKAKRLLNNQLQA